MVPKDRAEVETFASWLGVLVSGRLPPRTAWTELVQSLSFASVADGCAFLDSESSAYLRAPGPTTASQHWKKICAIASIKTMRLSWLNCPSQS